MRSDEHMILGLFEQLGEGLARDQAPNNLGEDWGHREDQQFATLCGSITLGDAVTTDELGDFRRIHDSFQSWARQQTMSHADNHILGSILLEFFGRGNNRSGGITHIIEDDSRFAKQQLMVTMKDTLLDDILLRIITRLAHGQEWQTKELGVFGRSFVTTLIRRNGHVVVFELRIYIKKLLVKERLHHQGTIDVVTGLVKETLNASIVEIHADNSIYTGQFKHVSEISRRNRRTGVVLLILPGIGIMWKQDRDTVGATTLTCPNHEKEFHDMIINGLSTKTITRRYNEDVEASNRTL